MKDRFADRFITGAAVRTARRHGLDVPSDRTILRLISAIRPPQAGDQIMMRPAERGSDPELFNEMAFSQ